MQFLIYSREQSVQYCAEKHSVPSIIISIRDPERRYTGRSLPWASQVNRVKDVLPLWFDDVDRTTSTSIKKYDAMQIAEFVRRHLNDVQLIIIHCETGTSRSAGIAAALMCYLNGDDSAVFHRPSYRPNLRCYQLTLHALVEGCGPK